MFPCSQMMREDDHIFKRKDFQEKHEADDTNTSKLTKAPSTSRQWSAFKNPRIVRVSRAFGGKDRHSKVCTVRGLRDRRIRLSVPTAIQLYDLQDRLGLSQPSKVVDWLLDATKLDIDKLPPLQMPPGNFSQFHQPALVSHELNVPHSSFPSLFNANTSYPKDGGTQSLFPCKEGIKLDYNMGNDQMMGKSKAWELDAGMGAKLKGVEREMILDKAKWMRTNERQNHVSPQNFLPTASNSSFNPSLLPYNYYQWEPSNLSLAQFGFPSHIEGTANTSHLMSLPSSLALSSGSQLFLCPPAATPSLFSPYPPYIATPGENETRQSNHFQWLSSNPQHMPPNPFVSSLQSFSSPMSAASKGLQLNSPTDIERLPNKDGTGS